MRPFSTLGVKPFLFANAAALAELQAQFHRLSREFHPDRFINASDEKRSEVEAKSATLNADYAYLRDPWDLIDSVLKTDDAQNAGVQRPVRSAPPPELAEEYFDLQELWSEKGPDNLEAKRHATLFLARVTERLSAAENEVMALAKKFPFAGTGEAPAPWTDADLEQMRAGVHKLRYYRSFDRDLRDKFLNS